MLMKKKEHVGTRRKEGAWRPRPHADKKMDLNESLECMGRRYGERGSIRKDPQNPESLRPEEERRTQDLGRTLNWHCRSTLFWGMQSWRPSSPASEYHGSPMLFWPLER